MYIVSPEPPAPEALNLPVRVYGVFGFSGIPIEVKSGLLLPVLPGMDSFIERAPSKAVVASIDQVAPESPPEIVQFVGEPEPDSNEPLLTQFGIEAVDSL
jgi:hypothetical protein